MNKVERLIQQLCQNGVEYKDLGDLGNFYGGLTGKSKKDFQNGNAKFITYMNVYSNIALDTAIEDFVREDQLMIATMARYKSHLKETRCGRCGRPYWHHLEELRKKGEYTNS